MKIDREYSPREINWVLLPDLLEQFRSSIPDSALVHQSDPAQAVPGFTIATYSQRVEIADSVDFLEFLRQSTETATEVTVRLACHRTPESYPAYEVIPPYLEFSWKERRIFAGLSRVPTEVALGFLQALEERLQLRPAKPPQIAEEELEKAKRHPPRTVFIAHAFDDVGRIYAFQLTKFLNLLGFEVATGEGFSPERVSSKVKRRLAAQGIVVGLLSEHQNMTWLIQETTGANFADKPLFLLVEEGSDFKPGVLGDLDYIRFTKGRISDAFTPILEGLRELGFRFT